LEESDAYMIKEAIQNFPKQFEVELEVGNKEEWKQHERFCVVGMGGSHLSADLLKRLRPSLDLIIHEDYGLPELPEGQWEHRLVILSSYSGNTEEVLDAFSKARERDLPVAVLSIGGKLLELARKHDVPYVEIPNTGILPRMATGFMLLALLKLIADEELYEKAKVLARQLKPAELEEEGSALAKRLFGKVPVIYASRKNVSVAYNWKIKFNESSKIPAFINVFPELNHNEMTGFDVAESTRSLSERTAFIFLRDDNDHSQIKKRMDVLRNLYAKRGLQVEEIHFQGSSDLYRVFSSLLLADWTAYYTSQLYGTEPEQVPMVEEFKKLI
ncbi:MAG: bifunctional phosphoglucose/phosphomannose isomerase, partial [bacterium]|nr:bifunctional phosphoglucose/phosphomannose isomerase [bacterium]